MASKWTLQHAVAVLDATKPSAAPAAGQPNPSRDAAKTLRYLGTAEAPREMVRRLNDENVSADCRFGLVGSPAHDAALQASLGELCHCFPSSGVSPCIRAAPVLVTRQLLQLLQRGVVDVIFFSRGFSHARLIHFLFDPREKRLVGFLSWLALIHTCTMSRVQRDYRSIGNSADSFGIVFSGEQF